MKFIDKLLKREPNNLIKELKRFIGNSWDNEAIGLAGALLCKLEPDNPEWSEE